MIPATRVLVRSVSSLPSSAQRKLLDLDVVSSVCVEIGAAQSLRTMPVRISGRAAEAADHRVGQHAIADVRRLASQVKTDVDGHCCASAACLIALAVASEINPADDSTTTVLVAATWRPSVRGQPGRPRHALRLFTLSASTLNAAVCNSNVVTRPEIDEALLQTPEVDEGGPHRSLAGGARVRIRPMSSA
jgi:hypothetical protein